MTENKRTSVVLPVTTSEDSYKEKFLDKVFGRLIRWNQTPKYMYITSIKT